MSDPTQADALAKQLKDSLAKRRPRPWKPVAVALIGSVVLLTLLAWWLYPRPKPGPLQLIGLDTIFAPDEVQVARAQLLAPPQDKAPRAMNGRTIVFRELAVPGGKAREALAKSDERGQAAADWPTNVSTEFLAQHIDPDRQQGSPQERGRIFVWPRDAPLLIVDADETLIADGLDAKAGETLVKAAADGWHIVYLALASNGANEFRTARGWLEKQAKLPKGPILARPRFDADASVESIRRELLKDLQGRFRRPPLAIVKNAESARTCKELELRTIVIGAAAVEGVLQAPTWADVIINLK